MIDELLPEQEPPFKDNLPIIEIQDSGENLATLANEAMHTSTKTEKAHFRPDIEGLRGIAILLVLLFHAQIPGFAGGFLGVDIFYVISGYLITGLLIRERELTGKIALKEFYARRVRRLLPAATVVLVATLIASYFLAPRLLMSTIAFDIASATLFLSNMNFAHHATDYFANTSPSPVLHFWSLSVEEQYYMLWPAMVLFFTRKAKSVSMRIFFALLTLGSLSFWFATWLLTKNQSWAFFSLPSRAWELALGGLLASSSIWIKKIPKKGFILAQWLGLGLLLYAAIHLKQTDKFPGLTALLPTLASALLLLGGFHHSSSGKGFRLVHLPTTILTSPPLKYLGKISYSLYLWHWPVLIISAYHYRNGLTLPQRASLVIVSIALSIVSFHFVENPIRRGKIVSTDPVRNLKIALAVILTVAGTCLALSVHLNSQAKGDGKVLLPIIKLALSPSTKSTLAPAQKKPVIITRPATVGFPLPKNLTPTLLSASNDRPITYADRCHTEQNLRPSTKPCMYGDPQGAKTIVLFGDSHALQWFPAVNKLAITNHWKLLSLTMSACTPADIPAWDRITGKVMPNCTLWRKESIKKILTIKPYLILVAGTRGFVTVDLQGKVLGGAEATTQWTVGIHKTLTQLKSASMHVIMIMDTPVSIYDPKVCLSESAKSTLACATPVSKALSTSWQVEEMKIATTNKIGLIDPSLWVCPTAPCPAVIGNVLVYLDAGHMTATYASLLAPVLKESITKVIKETTIAQK